MHNRQIFLLHAATFPQSPQGTRGFVPFRDKNHPAGFAVQSIYQMWTGFRSEIKSDAANEAGVFVGFGWVTDQARHFVDHQQVGVFMDNFEKLFHQLPSAGCRNVATVY
jgi:hypothetical protein